MQFEKYKKAEEIYKKISEYSSKLYDLEKVIKGSSLTISALPAFSLISSERKEYKLINDEKIKILLKDEKEIIISKIKELEILFNKL